MELDDLESLFNRLGLLPVKKVLPNNFGTELSENHGEDGETMAGNEPSTLVANARSLDTGTKQTIGCDSDRKGHRLVKKFKVTLPRNGATGVTYGFNEVGNDQEVAESKICSVTTVFEGMLEMTPEDIVRRLADPKFQFRKFLAKEPFPLEAIPVMIDILRLAASSTLYQPDLLSVLNDALCSSLFLSHVPQYLTKVSYGRMTCSDISSFLQSLVGLSSKLVERFPHNASENLSLVFLKCRDIVQRNEGEFAMDPSILEDIDRMESVREQIVSKYGAAASSRKAKAEFMHVMPAPNDFRDMSVVLTTSDIHKVFMPFLRPMVIGGPFQNVEHYLDVLFRLMREDFVGPLRDAVSYFVAMQSSGKLHKLDYRQIKVYLDVNVVSGIVDEKNGIFSKLTFDVSKFRRVDWEVTKRLQSGSLVCLSSNNFETFFLATVKDKELAKNNKSLVVNVEFLQNWPHIHRQSFVMIESPSFFEAYYYVLQGLKDFNEENLPFQQYLVGTATEVGIPRHLAGLTEKYEFPDGLQCNVLDFESWPTSKQLHLDASQYAALKAALTKEVAIIQGPPGTGKTYLGLKIMKILLANRRHWPSYHAISDDDDDILNRLHLRINDRAVHKPILVICYTNHALDQFLEGILKLQTGSSIVRVGGRSKNGSLDKYNLRTLRRNRSSLDYLNDYLYDLKKDLSAIVSEISRALNLLQRSETSILSEYELGYAIDEVHYVQLCMYRSGAMHHRASSLENWLTDDVKCDENRVRDEIKKTDMMSAKRVYTVRDLYRLSFDDRWRLYRFWLAAFRQATAHMLEQRRMEYNAADERLKNFYADRDVEILREMDVIGMTTTGAAKSRDALQKVSPFVVIVEEAAEVMEAHIITALSKGCEHLILIGDHKQLRPNPVVYRLAKQFHMDVSLFERLVLNGIQCNCLDLQHRMRPEIASLLVPHIYPNLKNHESVEKYKHIQGVNSDLFFVDHRQAEEGVDDSASRSNSFEADFAIALCRYLLKQDYEPEQITILTTYVGQLLLLKQKIKATKYDDMHKVYCAVVDNFQGEENDIIILSLVRSNDDGVIGFLRVDNRVCVALSRARMGLYAIGNFEFMAENSDIWKPITEKLKADHLLGPALVLRCPNHPGILIKVTNANDFKKSPEGGCQLPCAIKMKCGHICPKICHGYDRKHEAFQCMERCVKILCHLGHQCPDLCHQTCKTCAVVVLKQMPNCAHENKIPCYLDPSMFSCEQPCENVLSCGHQCTKKCFDLCGRCEMLVPKTLPLCGHEQLVPCHIDEHFFKCLHSCERTLPCEHVCPLVCSTPCKPEDCVVQINFSRPSCGHQYKGKCKNRSRPCHIEVEKKLPCGHLLITTCSDDLKGVVCEVKVKKMLTCGHVTVMKCGKDTSKYFCKVEIEKVLDCGHSCSTFCGKSVSELRCQKLVEKELSCYHKVKVACFQSEDESVLKQIQHPCVAKLRCGHKCRGECDQCHGGRIHVSCMEKCPYTLICGHACEGVCGDGCPPCQRTCETRCPHGACRGRCSFPCSPCEEPCSWQCDHYRCTKKCFEVCDRPPCQKRCSATLKCGHPCIGFCGEPCPPLCRICDKNKVFNKHCKVTDDDNDDVCFVLLEDCGHIVPVDGMDHWIKQSTSSVVEDFCLLTVRCPKCKAVIQHNFRYNAVIKAGAMNVSYIKHRLFQYEMKVQQDRKGSSLTVDSNRLRATAATVLKSYQDLLNSWCSFSKEVPSGVRHPRLVRKPQFSNAVITAEQYIRSRDVMESNISALRTVPFENGQKDAVLLFWVCCELVKHQYLMEALKLGTYELDIAAREACLRLVNILMSGMHTDGILPKLLLSTASLSCGKETSRIRQIKIDVWPDRNAAQWFRCENGHYYYISTLNTEPEDKTCKACEKGSKPLTQEAVMKMIKQELKIRQVPQTAQSSENEELEAFFSDFKDIGLEPVVAPVPPQDSVKASDQRHLFDTNDSPNTSKPWRGRGGRNRGRWPGKMPSQHSQQDSSWRARSISCDRRSLDYHSRDASPCSISSEPFGGKRRGSRPFRGRSKGNGPPTSQPLVVGYKPRPLMAIPLMTADGSQERTSCGHLPKGRYQSTRSRGTSHSAACPPASALAPVTTNMGDDKQQPSRGSGRGRSLGRGRGKRR